VTEWLILIVAHTEISVPFWAREWVNKSDLGKRARRRHNKRTNRLRRQEQADAALHADDQAEAAAGENEVDGADDDAVESVEDVEESKEKKAVDEREDIIYKLLYASTKLDPVRVAGLIVVDRDHRRIKIESPQYRLLRNMFLAQQPTVRERQMVDLVRTNDHATFLRYYAEWRPLYENVRERYDALCAYVDQVYALVKDMEARSYHEWVRRYASHQIA
jgi:hypothetical protein